MNLQNIFLNKIIIDEYHKIDENNAVPFNHGLKHVQNVVKIMGKLTDVIGITGEDREDLLLAAFLHDVGQADGRNDHGLKGAKIARSVLVDISEERLNKIMDGIKLHDQTENKNELPLFTNLLSFADKMDFTRNRFDDNWQERTPEWYKKNLGKNIYEHILSVGFEKNDGYLKVLIVTDGSLEKADFIERESTFMPKVINVTKALSTKLGFLPQILLDGKTPIL